MENKTQAASGGITFLGLLQVAFIILKITGIIKWSWWLVLIPIWFDLAIILLIILVAGIYVLIRKKRYEKNFK